MEIEKQFTAEYTPKEKIKMKKEFKITTNDDIINSLPLERQAKIQTETQKILEEHGWGGKRENSGRKKITGNILNFTKRLTKKEADFIDYARSHHLNYDDLMQG